MIRTTVAAAAIALFAFAAPATAQADPVAEQCARATIPTALCDGAGGTAPTNDGGGYVKAQLAEKYLSGSTPVIIGYQQGKNADGSPKVDDEGKPVMDDPIMGQSPVFGTKAGDEDGKPARTGDGVAVDYSGYQYK